MRKIIFMMMLILLTTQGFADEISQSISRARRDYLNKHYGRAVKAQIEALNRVFAVSLTNTIRYIPKLKTMSVVQTNMSYSFSGADDSMEYSLFVQKVMTNAKMQVAVTFDFSPLELDRYYSLFMSYDYLKNMKSLKRITFKKWKREYNYILNKHMGIMLFVFNEDKENLEIVSGMVMKIDLLLFRKLSKKKYEKTMTKIFWEILSKLKLKSLKWRFQ